MKFVADTSLRYFIRRDKTRFIYPDLCIFIDIEELQPKIELVFVVVADCLCSSLYSCVKYMFLLLLVCEFVKRLASVNSLIICKFTGALEFTLCHWYCCCYHLLWYACFLYQVSFPHFWTTFPFSHIRFRIHRHR